MVYYTYVQNGVMAGVYRGILQSSVRYCYYSGRGVISSNSGRKKGSVFFLTSCTGVQGPVAFTRWQKGERWRVKGGSGLGGWTGAVHILQYYKL